MGLLCFLPVGPFCGSRQSGPMLHAVRSLSLGALTSSSLFLWLRYGQSPWFPYSRAENPCVLPGRSGRVLDVWSWRAALVTQGSCCGIEGSQLSLQHRAAREGPGCCCRFSSWAHRTVLIVKGRSQYPTWRVGGAPSSEMSVLSVPRSLWPLIALSFASWDLRQRLPPPHHAPKES